MWRRRTGVVITFQCLGSEVRCPYKRRAAVYRLERRRVKCPLENEWNEGREDIFTSLLKCFWLENVAHEIFAHYINTFLFFWGLNPFTTAFGWFTSRFSPNGSPDDLDAFHRSTPVRWLVKSSIVSIRWTTSKRPLWRENSAKLQKQKLGGTFVCFGENFRSYETGDVFFGGVGREQSWWKSMVNLRDFPLVHCVGWYYNDPWLRKHWQNSVKHGKRAMDYQGARIVW